MTMIVLCQYRTALTRYAMRLLPLLMFRGMLMLSGDDDAYVEMAVLLRLGRFWHFDFCRPR
jgi:hypothetical protein